MSIFKDSFKGDDEVLECKVCTSSTSDSLGKPSLTQYQLHDTEISLDRMSANSHTGLDTAFQEVNPTFLQ